MTKSEEGVGYRRAFSSAELRTELVIGYSVTFKELNLSEPEQDTRIG